ncbi:DnaD domain-containing protein [Priestia aryabhattai]|uniref:DnaD domain-containing protein n=1 Tax=Priestia aryabhattai TaxID=412384 RepID=UPI001C8E38CB|nr:DnaD domain-containing protein [Priestia aryabhattai]MBY0077168.1 DnaD domain-containing protein [Priestia aryabhattai]
MKKETLIEWFEEGTVSIPKLLFNHYSDLGMNETEFMTLMHIYVSIEGGEGFPTPNELAAKMSISSAVCMDTLRALIQRGFLSIEQDQQQNALICERYSLKPLWEKLIHHMMQETREVEKSEEEQEELNLYTMFEKEFGRALSPFECETLAMWIDQDHHDPIIIKAALRESVMSGKLNFRYIDRILFEWKKNGIQTIDQARKHSQKFRQNQQPKKLSSVNPSQSTSAIPFFNWLEQ